MDAHLIFLQAAGMPPRMAERLADLVKDAVRRGTHDLPVRLSDAGFAPPLCRLIPLAVSLTLLGREESAAAAAQGDLLKEFDQLDAKAFDGVSVATMYNMINRVSNGFAISPEWSSWRRPAWLLRLSRRPAAWLLRRSMSFDNWERSGKSDEWLRKLEALLEPAGLGSMSADFQQLAQAPHLVEALCHLLAASTDAARLDTDVLRAIDRAVLLQLGADRLLPSDEAAADASLGSAELPTGDQSDICRSFAVRLTARPWSITEDEIGKLRTCGLSESQILDVAFRIAVLNGLGRLDRFCWAGARRDKDKT